MKTVAQLKAYLASHPGITNEKVRNNMHRHGVKTFEIEEARRALEGKEESCNHPACPCAITPKKRPLEEFVRAHDVAYKIRQGLNRLGDKVFMLDGEFREFCGVHVNQWRRFAELDEFSKNRLKHAGQIHWASESMISQMKGIVGTV